MLKKAIGILLSVIFLLPIPYTAMAETEPDMTAVEVAKELGLIPKESQAKDLVSRTDAVRYLLNLRNVTSYTGDGTRKFNDVSIYHEDYALLDTAVALELIKGDENGFFRPKEFATVQESMILLMRAMGYHKLADARGGSITDYYSLAREQNLMKGIDGLSDFIDIGTFAKMLHNSFDAGIMEQVSISGDASSYQINHDKTSLFFLGLKKGEGVVTDNEISSIHYSAEAAAEDAVKIDGTDFWIGNTDAAELLGYHVEYYYDDSEEEEQKELRYVTKTENKVLTLPLSSDFQYQNGTISYFDEQGKEVKINIHETDVMLLNGQSVAFDFQNIMQTAGTGSLTIIDNGESYRVVSIESYQNDMIASIDAEKIYLRYGQAGKAPYILLPEEADGGICNFYKDGAKIERDEIKNGQTVCIVAARRNISQRKLQCDC